MLELAKKQVGLVWFRSGLRLQDNAALYSALAAHSSVVCVYVLDDYYFARADIGAARVSFLLDCLSELRSSLESYGGSLIVRRANGDTSEQILSVAVEVGATHIYANADYLPYPMERDRRVADLAREQRIETIFCRDTLLVDPDDMLTDDGRPFTVFTPFKKRWESALRSPKPLAIQHLLPHLVQMPNVYSAPLPSLADFGLSLTQVIENAGEMRAYERLEQFIRDGLPVYHQNRDRAADPNSTSRLSMHIKWGTISIRDCYRAARQAGGPGADKWIDELAWREFCYSVSYHFPHVLTGPMLPEYGEFPWVDAPEHLDRWKSGTTGYPYVDAGMRQLNATGWMHNRLRQVVASFLCKDLCINWQEGERYFMQMLVDGDWPSNNAGWQWVAGTGTDPRRATRIFNPTLQMERYDPKAEYVRQWIPEYGTKRYLEPIVSHEEGRKRFLDSFRGTSVERHEAREARQLEDKWKPVSHRQRNSAASLQPSLFD